MLTVEQAKVYMDAYRLYSLRKRLLERYLESVGTKSEILETLVAKVNQRQIVLDYLIDIIKAGKSRTERIVIEDELIAYDLGIDFWRDYVGMVNDSAMEYIYDYVRSHDYTDENFCYDFDNDICNIGLS